MKATFGFGECVCWRSAGKLWLNTFSRGEQEHQRSPSRWITRTDVKVDRVACPWLIRRFIDTEADFFFVPEDQLLKTARRLEAIPFDAPGLSDVKLNHRNRRCTFEAIVEDYALDDPVLRKLGLIVRAADVRGEEQSAAEGMGLRAIAHGFAALGFSDEERLSREFPIYDALYEYVRRQAL